jgi:hypothetical protein
MVLPMSDEYLPASVEPQAAAPLSETDYEVICAAVTETERGRWFLTEYARRNRHADTEQVLAAIARLEAMMVAARTIGTQTKLRGDIADMVKAISSPQRTSTAGEVDGGGTVDKTATELDAIIQATERATSDILAAAERIQEIAWTMREQGVDDKACDELDGLATEIYTACSFQDLTGQQTDRVIEHLRHPDEPADTRPRLDQAGVDRVVPAQAAAAAMAGAAIAETAAEPVADSKPESPVEPVAGFEPVAEMALTPEAVVTAPIETAAATQEIAETPAETAHATPEIEIAATAVAVTTIDETVGETPVSHMADVAAEELFEAPADDVIEIATVTVEVPAEAAAPAEVSAEAQDSTASEASVATVETSADAVSPALAIIETAADNADEPPVAANDAVPPDAIAASVADTPVAAIAGDTIDDDAMAAEAEPETQAAAKPVEAINTDALLADLLAMIREAKHVDPAATPTTGQAKGDWNKPLFPSAPDSDVDWVDPPATKADEPAAPAAAFIETAQESGEESVEESIQQSVQEAAEAKTTPLPGLIDEDDLLLPMPVSWGTPSRAARPPSIAAEPAPVAKAGDAAPEIAEPPVVEPPATASEPMTEPPRPDLTPAAAAAAALSRPSPLAAVAAAALAGEPLSSVVASAPTVPADLPDVIPTRPPVSGQALAAVAALSTLSEAEKIALFS